MKIDLEGNLFKTEAVRVQKCEDILKEIFPLKINDVIYIENYNRKTVMTTTKGEFLVSAPFSKIKRLFFGSEIFTSGHCSYLLNKSFFDRVEGNFAVLKHEEKEFTVPVARRKMKVFFAECAKK